MANSKFEFDDTRAAIRADDLDKNERKEMLEKFKSVGGQVMRERSVTDSPQSGKSGSGKSDSGSRGVGGGVIENKLPSEMLRDKQRQEAEKVQRSRAEYEKALKKLSGAGARFMIRLRCFLAGLTPFSKPEIKPGFMAFLNLEVKQALVEFNLLGNDLFVQRPTIGKKIMHSLDAKNPLMMETLEFAHRMYNSEIFSPILNYGQDGSSAPVDRVIQSLKQIYKGLYLLYPFQETFRKAMDAALDIFIQEAQTAKLSAESLKGMSIKQKRFVTNVKALFGTAYPKLFHLICLADQIDYPPNSPLFEKAIGVTQADKLGQRKKGETTLRLDAGEVVENAAPVNTDAEEKKEENEEKKSGIYDTKEYQYGVSLMKMRTPPELVQRYDKTKRMLDKVPINDRILLAYIFFLEFDYEYSFVLTTNKIQINVDYSGGVKSDYRKQMADLYNESRPIIKSYEKYEEMVEEYKKIKDRKSSNYIEQSKLEEKAKSRCDVEGRNTRGLIRSFMENVAKQMAFMIADMKGAKTVVGNMEEIVRFESELEKKKRMNNKPVKQCIMDAYCFATAFKERLANGDLFPLVPMTSDEMIASFGSTFEAPVSNSTDSAES